MSIANAFLMALNLLFLVFLLAIILKSEFVISTCMVNASARLIFLFIRMIISLKDLDGVVFVELDLEGRLLREVEGSAGFIP